MDPQARLDSTNQQATTTKTRRTQATATRIERREEARAGTPVITPYYQHNIFTIMIVVVQNLQKIAGLASKQLEQHAPDVLLAQEINLPTEPRQEYTVAHNTSRRKGYGTAILGRKELSDVKLVASPHAEIGGFVVKKTTIATCDGIQFVSFHGYNGQPFKNVTNLLDHVKAIVEVLEKEGPALFAGDFNTWTQSHLDAVREELEQVGFQLVFSWPYPGRETPLDHAFIRSLCLKEASHFCNESDHRGSILEVVLADD